MTIDLWKRIPVSAGLAGGSTDAAATLVALDRLWELGLAAEELLTLAARLGSDVSFFVRGIPAAICRGRGEEIHPVGRPLGGPVVVSRPASGLSTAEVYRHCQVALVPCRSSRWLIRWPTVGLPPLRGFSTTLCNRLRQP
ncbi:MAG: hypothetical protein Ct9H300mP1_32020 [Planctomycetaceae bacterium]|nr:MAG: hypothetical protein Ct9H300mP1_32020 [Planctomycetaceae bacterium]